MKNEGITQGPWVAHVNYATQSGQVDPAHPHWCEVRSENNSPNGYPLSITGHFGISNARLIAAAPEMLAFAKWAMTQLQGESGAGETYWEQFPQYKAGIKAIDDAEGRA